MQLDVLKWKFKKMEPIYINNFGNCKPDTQYECYSAKTTIDIIKVMAVAPQNHKVYYNPRTVTKPPKELKMLIFTFIKRCKISLSALDASDTRPIACAFLGFM